MDQTALQGTGGWGEGCRIGLGTWGLGGVYYGEVADAVAERTVHEHLASGGRHIDTAFSYHKSEEMIGRALRGWPRESYFLTSKTYAGCFSPADLPKIRTELAISLRDLGVDYLDAYLIHGTPADRDHLLRLIEVFADLRAEGRIRHLGASIRGPAVDDASLATALGAIDTGRLDFLQLSFSVARQKHARAIAAAGQRGVKVVVRWVLESGFLTGKYAPGRVFPWPDTRQRYRPEERDAMLRIGQELGGMLPPGYTSPRELAVGFALAQPGVAGLILGANSPEHARANQALASLPPLPAETVERLRALYGPGNDDRNPTGEFEHVPSPRRPLEEP